MMDPISRYWNLYGGWRAFLASPYLFVSAIFTALCFPLWTSDRLADKWPDISIAILPSLMGFSIAGMAVLLAFSHPSSLRAITQRGKEDSYFVKTVANLFHFLLVQVVALLLALSATAYHHWVLSYFGILALVYAVFVSVAAAGQLLNTARIMNKAAWLPESPRDAPKDAESGTRRRSGTG